MSSRLAAVFISLSLLSPCFAEKNVARPTTLHLTLDKAVQMALGKNFSIEIERYSPKIGREAVREAEGAFDPRFDVSTSFGESVVSNVFGRRLDSDRTFDGLTHFMVGEIAQRREASTGISGITPLGTRYDFGLDITNVDPLNGYGERYDAEASIGLTQPLLRGAGTNYNLFGVRIARNNALASEWELRERILDIIDGAVAAYNELHFAHENLRVARGFRELAVQLVTDNTKRVDIGVMSPLNITTARAEAASREENVILAARQVIDRENALKQIITNDLESLLDIRVEIEPPPTPPFVANVRGGIEEALSYRPDYRQAMIEIDQRHITLAFRKNDALPRLDLKASLRFLGIDNDIGTSVNRIGNQDETAWTVGAIFSVPLPNREGRASVAAEKLRAARALVDLQRREQQIVVEVDNATGSVTTARQRIVSTGEARVLAKESLDAGEERLRAGTGTTFEVLELQKKLSEAESAELRAHTDFNKAVSAYYRTVGTALREFRVVLGPLPGAKKQPASRTAPR